VKFTEVSLVFVSVCTNIPNELCGKSGHWNKLVIQISRYCGTNFLLFSTKMFAFLRNGSAVIRSSGVTAEFLTARL